MKKIDMWIELCQGTLSEYNTKVFFKKPISWLSEIDI